MASRSKLDSLQAARGLAAVAVLLFHSEVVTSETHPHSPLATFFNLGFTGVDFFFLLSGFLMVWVHHADFGKPQRLLSYFQKRFARIYPVYWFLCLVLVPLTLRLPALRQNQDSSAGSLVASIFLLPHPGNRLLGVTWTLEYELLFYVTFAAFFYSARFGIALFSLWFTAITAAAIWGPLPLNPTGAPEWQSSLGWLFGFFLSLHLVEFFLGMTIAWLVLRGIDLPHPARIFAATVILTLAIQLFTFSRGTHDLHLEQGHRIVTLVAAALAGLLLFSMVQWEIARPPGATPIPAPLNLLGAASYSIYLTHFLVISFVRVAAHHSPRVESLPASVLFLILIVAGILPGIALHKLVERPLLAFTSRRLRSTHPEPAAEV